MRDNHDSISASTVSEGARFSEKVCREIYVLGAGTVGGALKEAAKHPEQTVVEIAGMSLTTAGITAMATAELPAIALVGVGSGVYFTGQYVWNFVDPNSAHNQERNRSFRAALDTASISSDPHALNAAIHDLQTKAGLDSLQVIEGLVAGSAIPFGPHIPSALKKVPFNDLVPLWHELDFATAGDVFQPQSFKNLSSHSSSSAEFVNFQAVPGTLKKFRLDLHEAWLDATVKRESPKESAEVRLNTKKKNTAERNDDAALPPPQGNGKFDQNGGMHFKQKSEHFQEHEQHR